jgi:ribosome-associated translation inhibitor RaiA
MEARLGGLGPVAANHEAENLELAINGALEKLERAIEHRLGKLAVSATGKRSVNE